MNNIPRTSDKILNKLYEAEELLTAGHGKKVTNILNNLTKKNLKRKYLFHIANLYRRSGSIDLGLKVLNPIIRPLIAIDKAATCKEKCEYAALLIKVGSVNEALKLLQTVEILESPEALLYQSFILFTKWNYIDATPLLKIYVKNPSLTDYEKTVGQINLAACYVHNKNIKDASIILNQLREKTLKNNFMLLHGNSLELSAQLELLNNDYKKCANYLDKAEKILSQMSELDKFFVKKWKAILMFSKNSKSKIALKQVLSIQEKAREIGHWETVRIIDYYIGYYQEDLDILGKVYHSTPYLRFKNMIRSENLSFFTKDHFIYCFDYEIKNDNHRIFKLDIEHAIINDKKTNIKLGSVVHRLFKILSSDLYRPFSLGLLYDHLFPDEYYNPQSSKSRIYQALKRLKKWFREDKIPLEIKCIKGLYSLSNIGSCHLIFKDSTENHSNFLHNDICYDELLKTFSKSQEFTTIAATEVLKKSTRTTSRLLKNFCDKGVIKKIGKGPSAKFKIAS